MTKYCIVLKDHKGSLKMRLQVLLIFGLIVAIVDSAQYTDPTAATDILTCTSVRCTIPITPEQRVVIREFEESIENTPEEDRENMVYNRTSPVVELEPFQEYRLLARFPIFFEPLRPSKNETIVTRKKRNTGAPRVCHSTSGQMVLYSAFRWGTDQAVIIAQGGVVQIFDQDKCNSYQCLNNFPCTCRDEIRLAHAIIFSNALNSFIVDSVMLHACVADS